MQLDYFTMVQFKKLSSLEKMVKKYKKLSY